jgi:hypothetical protein
MLSARHESGGKSGKNNNKSRRDGCKFAFLEVPLWDTHGQAPKMDFSPAADGEGGRSLGARASRPQVGE